MKPNPRRVWLMAAVVLPLFVAAGWFGIDYYRDKRALASYQLRLLEQGEKLSIEELIPRAASVDGDGTAIFFMAVTQIRGRSGGALGTNPPSAMRMVAHGRAMIGWRQPEVRDAHATNSWAEIRAELESYTEAFTLLQQLIEQPAIDYRLDYQLGHRLSTGQRIGHSSAARRLIAATLCRLRDGDTPAASTHIRAMLALVKGSTEERLILSQLMRMAIASLAFSAQWELLHAPDLTDEQLLALQRDWEELDFLPAVERALEMERAFGIQTADEMRASGEVFKQFSAPPFQNAGGTSPPSTNWTARVWEFAKDSWGKTRNQARRAAWRVAWADADQLTSLKGIQTSLDAVRQAQSTSAFFPALQAQERQLQALGFIGESVTIADGVGDGYSERDTRTLLSQMTIGHQLFQRVMVMEAWRSLVVTAIALERFELRHRQLPASMSVLVPEFLADVPRDPVGGEPLRYRRNEDGTFLLYSVGEDGVDDGGDPRPRNESSRSLSWRNGRDWVWPQPATPEEIAAFEKQWLKDE